MITTRIEALQMGVTRYFTGKPCKRGHISNRYTQNGGCVECMAKTTLTARQAMRDNNGEQRAAALAPLLAAREAAREVKDDADAQLVEIRVLIRDNTDRLMVFETTTELCLAAIPKLKRDDVWPNKKPVKEGTPVFRVLVPEDQVAFVREMTNLLWMAKSNVDFSHIHHSRLKAIEQQAVDESDEAPTGWR